MKYLRRGWLVAVGMAVLSVSRVPDAHAQSPNQAGLVVMHADGRVVTRCVAFNEPEITGYDLLARSGLALAVNFGAGAGGAVCALDGTGCSEADCFCQCKGTPCRYWVYYHLVDGQWAYANLGASMHTVRLGDVEGWAWGEGSSTGGAQPPAISFEQICAAPVAPTATPLPPTPTQQTAPTPTASVAPTLTLEPSPTLVATVVPVTATPTPTSMAMLLDTPTATPSPLGTTLASATPVPSAASLSGPEPEQDDEPAGTAPATFGYVAFGGIVLALSVGLRLSSRRRG